MILQVVGLNHRTAPVELRERLAFDSASLPLALDALRAATPPGSEVVILSTCNRVEVYHACPDDAASTAAADPYDVLITFLCQHCGVPVDELRPHVFVYQGADTARHLFAVAGGLDSMVLGESQIIHQVRSAWAAAYTAGTTGQLLHRLFNSAFEVAKRLRSQTAIAAGKVSVSSVAVDLVAEVFDRFADKTVLLVGAGKMCELTLRHLLPLGPAQVVVTNRSLPRAQALAQQFAEAGTPARAEPFEALYDLLTTADIVISGTGSREPVIRAEAFAPVPARRGYRTLLMIDIAVPRDIEPAVANSAANIYLYDIDDLNAIVAGTLQSRAGEVAQCQVLIDQAVRDFLQWLETRELGPLIGRLHQRYRDICTSELRRLRPKLTGNPQGDWPLIEQAFERTANKLLHIPVDQLKAVTGRAASVTSQLDALAPAVPRGAPFTATNSGGGLGDDPREPGRLIALFKRLFGLTSSTSATLSPQTPAEPLVSGPAVINTVSRR